jgi:hypothetical protein
MVQPAYEVPCVPAGQELVVMASAACEPPLEPLLEAPLLPDEEELLLLLLLLLLEDPLDELLAVVPELPEYEELLPPPHAARASDMTESRSRRRSRIRRCL